MNNRENPKKKKTNILYIANDMTIGGAEKIYLILSEYLNKEKYNLMFVIIGEKGEFYEDLAKNTKVELLHIYGRPLLNSQIIEAIMKIVDICHDFKPNIIQSQLWTSNMVSRMVGRITSTPIIIVEQNVYNNRSEERLSIDKILSNYTYKIVAVSEAVKNFIKTKQKIDENKITIIENSIDFRKFDNFKNSALRKEFNIKKETSLIVNVAMLGRTKNQSMILESLKNIKEEDFFLLFVGDGLDKESLKKKVKNCGLTDKVKFLKWRRDVPQILNESDIFILPSYQEGLSLSLMEAMYMKKLCIVSEIPSNKILIKEGINGFLFPTNDAKKLSRILKKIIINGTDKFEKIKFNARKTIMDNFSTDTMIKAYEKLYEDCLKNTSN